MKIIYTGDANISDNFPHRIANATMLPVCSLQFDFNSKKSKEHMLNMS